jgi:hypothetical protein
VQGIRRFFAEIDAHWVPNAGPVQLRLIGSTALMLQAPYDRATTDSDILEGAHLDGPTRSQLLDIAGPGTEVHRRHGMYVQIVSEGIPFLPQVPHWRTVPDLTLVNLEVVVLDVVDVVVSKLKRFHAKDAADIEAMIEHGLVPHAGLIDRFRQAVDWIAYDARGEELPRYVANLNRVERDFMAVLETPIELPSWIR